MAMPGIEKARAAARDAQEHTDIAERSLTNALIELADACRTDGVITRMPTHEEHTSIRALSESLTLWEAKTKRLWDQVSFMEET
jgi:hypothetical protein